MFSSIDVFILLFVGFSMIISVVRGFTREAVSLGTWIGAIVITLVFTSRFATLLPRDTIESPEARYSISALALFFGTLALGGLVNYLFQQIMANRKRKKLDLILALGFGAARGCVIAILLVLLSNLIPTFKQESWWQESFFIPPMQKVAQIIHGRLPRELAQHFDFSTTSL